MTTTTSYSKQARFWGLYKSTFLRYIGYFSLLSALLAIFYPFQYAMEAFKVIDPTTLSLQQTESIYHLYSLHGLGKNFTPVSAVLFTGIVLIAPIVLSLILNSYMHSKKASDVYHALPIERELLLGINAAVAMSYIAIPVVLSNLIVILLQIAHFGFSPALIGYLLLDMLGWLICAFAIYTVTTFVCICVGTAFDSFVFSCALLVIGSLLSGLFLLMGSTFLYGFHIDESFLYTIMNLSPLTLMPMRFSLVSRFEGMVLFDDAARQCLHNSNLALLLWLLFSIMLFYISVRLYRRRNSEIAETTSSKGLLQVIITLYGAIVCTIGTGFIFYSITYPNQKMTFIMWGIIGGVLGYAIIEVILNRGFKTLVKSLPMGIIMVGVSIGGCLLFMTGGLGYENRVPAPEKITSVELGYFGRMGANEPLFASGPILYTTESGAEIREHRHTIDSVTLKDSKNIAAITDFHINAAQSKFQRNESELLDAGHTEARGNVRITYHLTNGRSLTRYYYRTTSETLRCLAPLEVSQEFLLQAHSAFVTNAEDITRWMFFDPFMSKQIESPLSLSDSQTLLEAIRSDLSEITLEELENPKSRPIASIRFNARLPVQGSERSALSGYFLVTDSTRNTYAFLEKKGYLERLTTDWEDCYAVSGQLYQGSRDGEYFYRFNSAPIVQLSANEQFMSADYANIKEELERIRNTLHYENDTEKLRLLAEQGLAYTKYSDNEDFARLFEHPADIETMADTMVGYYRIGEPLVYANFYFEDRIEGTPVLLPLSRLPATLQEQFISANAYFK